MPGTPGSKEGFMDFSKFKVSTWLMTVGALVMLISGLFLDWAKIDFFGESFSEGNAFDWTRGWISWILVIAVGGTAIATAAGKSVGRSNLPLIQTALSAIAALLMLLLIITGPDKEGLDLGRALGLWISFIATVAVFAGSIMNLTESGGNLKDLTDVNKLKDSFGSGGATPPPPPGA
jgi:hypothetical protein